MAETPNRLFLLDGMALLYRAHFALIRNPRFTSQGVNTSAIFGFLNTLLSIQTNQQPTHLGVAFDTKEPTPRHKIFPEYKAHRDAMPEDLAFAIPQVKRFLQALNIPIIELPGYEADDIIGTLATQADLEGSFHTYMVTPDKDFAQLVTQTTSMWKPGRKGSEVEILDPAAICETWDIESPLQVIDILALWGDAADNIPGVPGIGEKTAKKLIKQFGSVETLLKSTDQLKGKQKENVQNNSKEALLSKELVTIIKDCPIDTNWDDFKLNNSDDTAVKALLAEFELNQLATRMYGNDAKVSAPDPTKAQTKKIRSYDSKSTQYTLIDTEEKLIKLVRDLNKQDAYCFDLETTSLNPRTSKVLGIALCWKANLAYFIAPNQSLPIATIIEALRPALLSKQTKIGHNLKFDLAVLLAQGITVKGPFFDTMLAHSLTAPEQRHNMDYVAESLLSYNTIKLSDIAKEAPTEEGDDLFSLAEKKKPSKKGEINMSLIPLEQLCIYACEDADITFQMAEPLAEQIEETGMSHIFYDLESALLPVLTAIEQEGIRIDLSSLESISHTLQSRIDHLSTHIIDLAGREFNLKSPKQLGEILFDELKIEENPKKTKTGQYKTDEQTLTALSHKHEIVASILDYRESTKLKSTYVDALPEHICTSDQRIHTNYHQLLTSTGRLASSDPNLQNIPVRSTAGREIRKAFIPKDGYTLFSADYSQVELRIMAAIAGDPAMIEAFQNDLDIHTSTAARVYGVGLEETTPEMRRTAKMVNFGIIYGISAFGLSQRLGIPRKEAAAIIETYWQEYPAVQTFMDDIVEKTKELGYVQTLSGRRRLLPDIQSRNGMIKNNAARAAINTPIQGTAADMIKFAMLKVDSLLREGNYRSKMLLQVHDELILEMHLEEQQELAPLICTAMETALALPNNVPLKVDSGFGQNWLEAH